MMNRLVSSGIFLLCSNYIGQGKGGGKEKSMVSRYFGHFVNESFYNNYNLFLIY